MKIKDYFNIYPKDELRIVLSYLLDISFGDLSRMMDKDLEDDHDQALREVFDKIKQGHPLQYALGKWDFFGRTFDLDPNVLIPRPETELLVEAILKEKIGDKKILDIGTGSGAIAISLKLEDETAQVWASDISQPALDRAMANAKKLQADIKFIRSDLFENIKGKFDIIVSNPPYISQKDYDKLDELLYYEPKNALLAGDKGYEIYERIISSAWNFLNDQASLYFEIGYDQKEVVTRLLKDHGFEDIRVIKDYGQKDRILIAKKK
ncbi:MAG: peptide chain release factor N(5)-glutamine methyltransferase [Tissierellia bacterium]|nr:peptide chain release factor N(5)-glutamine methyltransferase [Tissierellia bacterium]